MSAAGDRRRVATAPTPPRMPLAEVIDRGLVERLPAAVYTARPGADGEWLFVSPQIEQILGVTPEEIMADPTLWARHLHPEDRDRVIREDADVARSGGYQEYRMLHRDGRVVWVLDDLALVRDPEHGHLQQGMLYDISRRKRTELVLAEHADIVERVARGDRLEAILVELARSTDRVSDTGHCVVVMGADGDPEQVTVDARGATAGAGEGHEAGWEVPIRSASGEQLGRIIIGYPTDVRPAQDDDLDLATWAARLAAVSIERASQDHRMATSLSLVEATLESTADGILVVDGDGRIVGHNAKFRLMWRIPDELLAAGDDGLLLQFVIDQLAEPERFLAQVRALYETPEATSLDVLEFVDGRVFERFSQAQRIDGRCVGRVWSFRDMTSHRRLEEELRRQAESDPLTPLPNRRLFMERLEATLHRRKAGAGTVAVLLLDIDDFKTVNDSLGHGAGDELLIAVARRLLGCLRGSDTAARFGGDEFVILLPDLTGPEQAVSAARRILSSLEAPVAVAGQLVSARASIGIAMAHTDARPGDLVRDADLALFVAKREGGGGFRCFEPAMHLEAVDRLELKADLEHALDRRELSLAYQPVVCLDSGRIVGAEALIRWAHPRRGQVPPMLFIPLAEESGLIERIGRWVLGEACRQLGGWRAADPAAVELTMSVNLSPRQLSDPALPAAVEQVLALAGLSPSSLLLEITEGALAQPAVDVVGMLQRLRRIGVGLALDDFGTGYSSLSYLDSYPLDVLKLDRSFVERLGAGERNAALVRAVLQLAEALGLQVVAEGIETAEQLRRLTELRCARGQGYHLSRPVSAEEFARLLREERRAVIGAKSLTGVSRSGR